MLRHRSGADAVMKLAVVTGATGFTGPYVVRALRQRFPGLALRCVVRPTSRTDSIGLPGVSTAVADLRDPRALPAAFEGADTLVNVASLGFDWTENVVTSAQRAGIDRAVFISTTAILTRLPVASKSVRTRGEALVQASGMRWTLLRPTMIYGTPQDRNIARLIRFVDRSPVVPIIAADAVQQPVHVEDVASAVVAVLEEERTIGRVYIISGRAPLPLVALVREVAAALGRRRLLVRVPMAPVLAAVRLWSKVSRPPVTVEQLLRIQEDKSFDYGDAAREFGFAPRDFATGVRAEVELYRRRG
jgi:uncharacterized protein YbjT (DUF2867 family)